jgi:hypothetical protein
MKVRAGSTWKIGEAGVGALMQISNFAWSVCVIERSLRRSSWGVSS